MCIAIQFPHKPADSRSITDPSRVYWSCQCQ